MRRPKWPELSSSLSHFSWTSDTYQVHCSKCSRWQWSGCMSSTHPRHASTRWASVTSDQWWCAVTNDLCPTLRDIARHWTRVRPSICRDAEARWVTQQLNNWTCVDCLNEGTVSDHARTFRYCLDKWMSGWLVQISKSDYCWLDREVC